jgi:acyl-coenzyme A synthetase/AMP-(fatty) acid ligase
MLAEVVDQVLPIDDSTTAESTPDPAAATLPTASSSNAAYVIYTSGSTGKPKVSIYPL